MSNKTLEELDELIRFHRGEIEIYRPKTETRSEKDLRRNSKARYLQRWKTR